MTSDLSLAVIGGSGFAKLLQPVDTLTVATPYGDPSAPISVCEVAGRPVAFLPRHGLHHEQAPHRVNYRANLWALHQLGVRQVLGPFAAGAIDRSLSIGDLVVPHQLVDRTSGRADTFHDDFADGVFHAPFADPYDEELRATVLRAAARIGTDVRADGTVVVIQGPRFGTRAEAHWYASQGWQLVNMTQYPEAVLARELAMSYAGIALVTDADSGDETGSGVAQEHVFAEFDRHLGRLRDLLLASIADLSQMSFSNGESPGRGEPSPRRSAP